MNKFKKHLNESVSFNQVVDELMPLLKQREPNSVSTNDVAELCNKLNVEPEVIYNVMLELLRSFFGEGNSSRYDGAYSEQLHQGSIVEFEHTTSNYFASKIAMDHLAEMKGSFYYTYLNQMEKLAEIDGVKGQDEV